MKKLPFAFVALLAFVHCAELPNVTGQQCGNGVLDPGEACDPYSAGISTEAGSGPVCRPPGNPFACRIDCTSSACPEDYGCDVASKICRKVSGTYRERSAAIEAAAETIVLDDLDGDGRADAITGTRVLTETGSRLRIHNFSKEGELEKMTEFPRNVISPSVTSYSNRRSLVLGSEGISIVQVTANRAFEPQLLPSFSLVTNMVADRAFNAFPIFSDGAMLLRGADPSQQAIAVPTPATMTIKEFDTAPLLGTRYATLAGVTDVNTILHVSGTAGKPLQFLKRSAECGNAIVGAQGTATAQIFSYQCLSKDALPAPKVPANITLTVSANTPKCAGQASDPIQAADALYDRILVVDETVLLSRTLKATGRVISWVASVTSDTTAEVCRAADIVVPNTGMLPLFDATIFDLVYLKDAKVRVLVAAGGVLVVQDPKPAVPTYLVSGPAWTTAITGDFNGDGQLDIAGAHGTQGKGPSRLDVNIDLLFGSGDGRFVPTVVASAEPVTHLIKGDLNADGIDDLAYGERSTLDVNRYAVKALFGRRTGVGDPIALGTVNNLRALRYLGIGSASVLPLPLAGPQSLPATPKLGIITDRFEAVAIGAPDQLLVSSFFARATQTGMGKEGEGPPQALAVGHFRSATELTLAAFLRTGATPATTLWTTTTGSGEYADAVRLVKNSQGLVTLAATRRNPNGGGLDELLVVNGKALQRVDSELGTFSPVADINGMVPPLGSRLVTLDLNLDGIDDLALERPDQDALFYLGTSAGAFDAARSSPGIRWISSGARVLGSDGTSVFALELKDGIVKTTALSLVATKSASGLRNVSGVAQGDVNGDGIRDIAIIDQNTLRVFFGEENAP
jgi:hypothetical protein